MCMWNVSERVWTLVEKQLGRNEKPRKVEDKAGSPGEMPVVAQEKTHAVGEEADALTLHGRVHTEVLRTGVVLVKNIR